MLRLALGVLFALTLGACDRSDDERYLHDASFRRDALRASLVNRDNYYSQQRLLHYARDWDALPAWNPTGVPTDGELRDIGEAAFFGYPAQAAPLGISDGTIEVTYVDGSVGRAMTCATCHSREGVPGVPNQAIDFGWGAGLVDVSASGEAPIAIPDLRPVKWQTHLQRDGAVENSHIALAIRIETLVITSHAEAIRPPRVIALGLATYLESLAPAARALDASRGALVFSAECASCHPAPRYAGPPVPLAAVGTDPRVGESKERGTGGYRAPSLYGAASRGALLHDATVPDLPTLLDPTREVPGHRYGDTLTADDRAALLAFLATL